MSDLNMSEDQILSFTQGIRKDLVTDMIKAGVPSDDKQKVILLTALADMDRSALGNKRIKKDEQIASDDRHAQAALAKIYASMGNDNPFHKQPVIEGTCRVIPQMPDVLDPDAVFDSGEMEIGIKSETYDEFSKRVDL